MAETRTDFEFFVVAGLLFAPFVGLFYLLKGACLSLYWGFILLFGRDVYTPHPKEKAVTYSNPAPPRKRKSSNGWTKFWAWNAYNYYEQDYYDRQRQGLL